MPHLRFHFELEIGFCWLAKVGFCYVVSLQLCAVVIFFWYTLMYVHDLLMGAKTSVYNRCWAVEKHWFLASNCFCYLIYLNLVLKLTDGSLRMVMASLV